MAMTMDITKDMDITKAMEVDTSEKDIDLILFAQYLLSISIFIHITIILYSS